MSAAESASGSLTWERRPLAELIRLAWPITISTLSYATMTLVDTLFVGRIGAHALAGVGLGGVGVWGLICFALGLMRGANVLVAQSVGAGTPERSREVVAAVLLYALVLGMVATTAAQLLAPGLGALSATPAAARSAEAYFSLRSLSAPIVILFWGLREVRQALGDARGPMVASVVANITNLVLDYLLILHWGFGVPGAALASVLSATVELTVLMALHDGLGMAPRCGWRDVRAVWWLGWPSGVAMALEMGSFSLLSLMIARYSETHMAAHQIALQLTHISFLPAFAVGEATMVLCGQAVGAMRLRLVPRVARLGLTLAVLYTGVCSLVLALGAGALASLFTEDAALHAVVVRLLQVAAVFQIFDGASIVGRCALRGTGDVRYPAVVGTLTAWCLTPPLMWLLGYQLMLGAIGGWIGLCLELVLAAALFWWRIARNGWLHAARQAAAVRRDGAAEPAPKTLLSA